MSLNKNSDFELIKPKPNPELENLYQNDKQKEFVKEKERLDVDAIKNIGDKYDNATTKNGDFRYNIFNIDKITAEKYEQFDQYHLVYNHKKLNQQIIRKYLSKAYTSYYLRINWLSKYVKSFLLS